MSGINELFFFMKYHFSFLPFLKILHLSGINALIIAITQNLGALSLISKNYSP